MDDARIGKLKHMAEEHFPGFLKRPAHLVSAPGRMELLGNHTDHQHGLALATAINLDTLGLAAENGTDAVRVFSEGWPGIEFDVPDLHVREDAFGAPGALVKGVLHAFAKSGVTVGGFDAVLTSDVLMGSGLSSSASFEVWIAEAVNALFCEKRASGVELAKAGQYAENVFYGKPCGLEDQLACAVGGLVFIDFSDTENPAVEKIDASLEGYTICVVDVQADHAGLTPHYAAVREELTAVSAEFGAPYLRKVDKGAFLARIPELREKLGDRAVLRALHIFEENERVLCAKEALGRGDTAAYFRHVRASGFSSFMYLQNVSIAGAVERQPLAVALALAGDVLGDQGAYRIQGGGFAGTVEAFVPDDLLPAFLAKATGVFGADACRVLSIRQEGAVSRPLPQGV
ncbi:MAG: galactokinase [Clostridiales Family XIII bacterium]|jgi:galactokinase|nr:galactokinase [Clostridiales Family XIII bacterium]